MPSETCILGLGSPNGDDQAGWRIVERLQRHTDTAVAIFASADPLRLIELDQDYWGVIVVDACSTGGAAGTITRLQWPDSRIRSRHGHSSHSFSVAEALHLADQMGRLPEHVVLFGIETGTCRPDAAMSAAVVRALPALEQQVLQEVVRSEGVALG